MSSSAVDVDEVEAEPSSRVRDHQPISPTSQTRFRPRSKHVNLNANVEARIENPLSGLAVRTLLRAVDEFVRDKGLEEHRAVIRKGALVARDPTGYEDITGEEALTEVEIDALRDEILHKWRISNVLFLTVVSCSIGAIVQGWDQTGTNGATVSFPGALGIGGDSINDKLLVGLVNAAPYIGTSLVGCWLSDPINSLVGRRGTIFFAANFCLWPVVGSAFCNTWQQLLICRLLIGIGMGTKASTVPIFAAENSPAPIRGALVMGWQLWTAFGIFLGTCANLAVSSFGPEAWRYQLGSAVIPAVPLAILIYFCPESPRWYMKKNRYRDAMKSLLLLRNNAVQAGRDLYYIHVQLELEHQFMGKGNYFNRIIELFTIPRIRRASLAAFTVMIAQQMCGINIIAFYSTTVFKDAGANDFEALLASWGFGLINFLFAFPAIWTIDTFGRRSLLLFTFPQMAWTLMAAGLSTLIPGKGVHIWGWWPSSSIYTPPFTHLGRAQFPLRMLQKFSLSRIEKSGWPRLSQHAYSSLRLCLSPSHSCC
uniref:Major facilitator superfamily (MFS) profile domain-containing protein n=1 Tax=Bionectria ochroleuca TaxID=29856 RepID=A0A8H7NDF3_BIOOC